MSNLLADILLVLHASFVVFVVSGLVLIIAGKAFSWAWVRNRWFRIVHLGCIGIVVVQSWFGIICPLTTLEMALRAKGGGAAYEGTFISHWLGEFLYYEAPAWVFLLVYTVFGMLVVFTWFRVPPR
ncbi:MAG: DUF2784 domain-containing protein [Gammaproteobacteria bacterium]|jgi:hypothetical protein|nr:DUF2784 domain-containing protein [Gammaproteobacteria bacterium]MDH3820356.1 DUF2784 domain-containing protein [Gammaproteobacteria bacterium]MDH3983392.1 DUF2784 domain-containing protein [Gammaproteobacteria bacterium]